MLKVKIYRKTIRLYLGEIFWVIFDISEKRCIFAKDINLYETNYYEVF
jgi:hypothetical protein